MNKQKKYWLGGELPGDQDKFFIEALDDTLWTAGSRDDWDTCWSTEMPDRDLYDIMDASKTINHIPGNSALTIKSNLYKTLSKAKQAIQGQAQETRYQFFPTTYSMPEEYFQFQQVAAQQPDWMWIQKPRNMSRGRGIEMVQHPETVPLGNEWIIQRYLDKPHLWDGYKYVLRCYVLITSVEPLRFYWYHEGSAKLTSEKYDLDDLDNPYRHLTNPDINEHNEEAEVPVVFHSFRIYKEWLRSQGIDDQKLFADIQDMIALTVIAAREKMREQKQSLTTDTQGAYELIGLDCMVDSDLKPWILECNLSPSLEVCSTDEAQAKEEIQTKKGMVTEIVNMLGLNDTDRDTLSSIERIQREMQRADGFHCVFPSQEANRYLNCFPTPRFADIHSLPEGFQIDYEQLSFNVPAGTEAVFEDSLALLAKDPIKKTSAYITPNELATWIWIQISAGKNPTEIADELSQTFGAVEQAQNPEQLSWLAQIWEMLADWSNAHLFNADNDFLNDLEIRDQDLSLDWIDAGVINLAGSSIQLRCACPIAASYIKRFSSTEIEFPNKLLPIDILRSSYGYVVLSGTRVLSGSRKLSRLLDDCIKVIAKHSVQGDDITLAQGAVVSHKNHNAIIVGNREQLDSFAYELCRYNQETRILSGSPIISAQNTVVKCTDLPILLPSNTDEIGSTYDPSNYYVQKPEQQHPLNSEYSLVKQDWIISETADQSCWLAPANGVFEQLAQIDHIIFIEQSEDADSVSITPMNSAETLASLWKNCHQKNLKTTTQLPEWLKGIQGHTLMCKDLKQAKSALQSVTDLFA